MCEGDNRFLDFPTNVLGENIKVIGGCKEQNIDDRTIGEKSNEVHVLKETNARRNSIRLWCSTCEYSTSTRRALWQHEMECLTGGQDSVLGKRAMKREKKNKQKKERRIQGELENEENGMISKIETILEHILKKSNVSKRERRTLQGKI